MGQWGYPLTREPGNEARVPLLLDRGYVRTLFRLCVIREVSALLSEVLRYYEKRFCWVASARELLRAREQRAAVLPTSQLSVPEREH